MTAGGFNLAVLYRSHAIDGDWRQYREFVG
ncbi:hypothetical protein X729_31690 [Mesorhizobium sp. L103C131B0]|nr:hypothetical protein X729_31690 [Mesorhizobium sp. L103C131B0]